MSLLVEEWAADWDDGQLAAALHRTAKLGSLPGTNRSLLTATMAALAEAYLPRVAGLKLPKDGAKALWACAKAGCWDGGLAEALGSRFVQGECQLLRLANGQDHANIWWALSVGPAALADEARRSGLLAASAASLQGMGPADLDSTQICSNVLLACARLRYGSSPALLHHLTACLSDPAWGPKPQHLANALYALGELREDCGHTPRPQDLQRLADRAAAMLERGIVGASCMFIPQELSNMLYGCTKLGYDHPSLLQPLAISVQRSVERMQAQGVSNSLYALAVMGLTDPAYAPLVRCLAAEVQRRELGSFKPQELSNSLYALAILQTAYATPPEAVWALAAEVQRRDLSTFLPQNLSNCLYALALRQSAYGTPSEAVRALAAECRNRSFDGFNSQALSNAAWALARLGHSDQGWYAAALTAMTQSPIMQSAKPQAWSNLWYTLAQIRHRPVGLLECMHACGALDALRDGANAQDCANMLWALAVLGLYDERLVGVLAARLGELPREQVNAQNVANGLWALAAMPEGALSRHRGPLEGLLREAARRGPGAFSQEELAQLWQLQQELRAADGLAPRGSGRATASARPKDGHAVDLAASPLQRDVVGMLTRLQQQLRNAAAAEGEDSASKSAAGPAILSVLPEQPVEGLCGRVDVLVELAGGRLVAVEVDGPSHFLANEPHTKGGRTQLRDRQLRRVFGPGSVVSVPYWEWRQVQRAGEAERQRYLCRLLGLLPAAGGEGR